LVRFWAKLRRNLGKKWLDLGQKNLACLDVHFYEDFLSWPAFC